MPKDYSHKSWAMRKSWLRKGKVPKGFRVSIYQGPHPSETFKDVLVWWREVYKSRLDDFFKQVYGPVIHELIAKDIKWLTPEEPRSES